MVRRRIPEQKDNPPVDRSVIFEWSDGTELQIDDPVLYDLIHRLGRPKIATVASIKVFEDIPEAQGA